MKEHCRNESGFTLLEILVAVVICGIALTVMIEGYLAMSGLIQQMKEYQLVSTFAREKMNHLIHKTDPATGGQETVKTIPVEWHIDEADMGDGVRRVTISVDWQGYKGDRQFELSTLTEGGSYENRE